MRSRVREHQIAALGRFGRYKPIDGELLRDPSLKEHALLPLIEAWEATAHIKLNVTDYYQKKLSEALGSTVIGGKEVTDFFRLLAIYEQQGIPAFSSRAGLFLSAITERRSERSFRFDIRGFGEKLGFLAYRNSKEVIIEGNPGYQLAKYMSDGTV